MSVVTSKQWESHNLNLLQASLKPTRSPRSRTATGVGKSRLCRRAAPGTRNPALRHFNQLPNAGPNTGRNSRMRQMNRARPLCRQLCIKRCLTCQLREIPRDEAFRPDKAHCFCKKECRKLLTSFQTILTSWRK